MKRGTIENIQVRRALISKLVIAHAVSASFLLSLKEPSAMRTFVKRNGSGTFPVFSLPHRGFVK